MRKWLLAGAAMCLAFFSGLAVYFLQQSMTRETTPVSATQTPLLAGQDVLGRQNPPFSLPDLDGMVRAIAEWRGRVILLNFWATWCSPCREEIPILIDLQERLADQGLQVVGVALEQAEQVRDFANELKINYPVLVGEQEVVRITLEYGNDIGALPYTAIIDRDGRIVFVKRGPVSGPEAEAIINALL